MKLKDITIGQSLFFKKNNIYGINGDTPFVVEDIEVRRSKHNRVIIAGRKVSPAELTDTPCSQMICGQYKYHTGEKK